MLKLVYFIIPLFLLFISTQGSSGQIIGAGQMPGPTFQHTTIPQFPSTLGSWDNASYPTAQGYRHQIASTSAGGKYPYVHIWVSRNAKIFFTPIPKEKGVDALRGQRVSVIMGEGFYITTGCWSIILQK